MQIQLYQVTGTKRTYRARILGFRYCRTVSREFLLATKYWKENKIGTDNLNNTNQAMNPDTCNIFFQYTLFYVTFSRDSYILMGVWSVIC